MKTLALIEQFFLTQNADRLTGFSKLIILFSLIGAFTTLIATIKLISIL